ncbi:hypothetical protein [Paenibacillus pedocola]|uniref:hypothetical protein n=1 Tax=Paenibacillus pedocola TaxID=3242193 RepID=UPI0028779C60|nr:hypothetical protein [Paenibacillus typhae]
MSQIKNTTKTVEEQVEPEMTDDLNGNVLNDVTEVDEPAVEKASIYLGPNLPGGRLLQSTVFRTGIPTYLQPIFTEKPDVAELTVPVEGMAEVQERIVQAGTAEYAAYQRLLGKGN